MLVVICINCNSISHLAFTCTVTQKHAIIFLKLDDWHSNLDLPRNIWFLCVNIHQTMTKKVALCANMLKSGLRLVNMQLYLKKHAINNYGPCMKYSQRLYNVHKLGCKFTYQQVLHTCRSRWLNETQSHLNVAPFVSITID